MSLRSPLGRVLGRGSAGEGVSHWWVQRVTAIALAPLALWFVFAVLGRPSLAYEDVALWLARPWNAVLMLLFVSVLIWHSKLGVQVVIEDYVHAKGLKVAALLASTFAHAALGVTAVFAILRVAFTFKL